MTDSPIQIHDSSLAKTLASHLLDIHAVVLKPDEPLTWSSGWNSPIYCDNRLTLRYPEIRTLIRDGFLEILKELPIKPHVITGTATAGIPHAAWVAEAATLPMAYVRGKAKAHGLGNQIEGGIDKGEQTVVIEDLISTGGSALGVIDALEFVGVEVTALLSIFTYGFHEANEAFGAKGIPVYSLTDYSTLIDVAVDKGMVSSSDLQTLEQWRQSPETWPAS